METITIPSILWVLDSKLNGWKRFFIPRIGTEIHIVATRGYHHCNNPNLNTFNLQHENQNHLFLSGQLTCNHLTTSNMDDDRAVHELALVNIDNKLSVPLELRIGPQLGKLPCSARQQVLGITIITI